MKDAALTNARIPPSDDESQATALDVNTEADGQQDFGDSPTEIRESNHYVEEYVTSFVEKWDELIDWKRRAQSEGAFFIDQLKARGVREVLDVATGTGYHSVRLLEAGFEVVSADGSPHMLVKAFENGRSFGGYVLRVVEADWRWLNRDVHGTYDAIVCLGNSFTHLFSERDRRKTLAEFYAMLKHDGVLIIDQRNYDTILDDGFSSKHAYYYCGEEIKVEPEHIDDGLARFRYTFPDESVYHLNMFPLRKNYMRRLLREVGFQRIETYGDFQSTYSDGDPDFFIHIAEKIYRCEEQAVDLYSNAVNTARDYYNSEDADSFYAVVWGGEDIHVGMYADESEEISVASRRTVESMADLGELSRESGVLDLGAGYGGAARYLASTYGCRVTCLNLSEVENARNRRLNAEQGLEELIEVVDGSFEDVPFQDNTFDVVWSQDSLLHSGDRARVLEEAVRVLRPGGQMIFTDPMATERANKEDLKLILQRLQLDTLATPSFYQRELLRLGVRSVDFHDHSEQLPRHYQRVYDELVRRKPELAGRVSDEYCTRMQTGLQYWVQGGKAGNLAWGIFHARN